MTGLGSSCGACKFLRRRCTPDCVFAPYFSYEQASTHFSAVHKVFGASNVSKLLSHMPKPYRNDAAITLSYEALARMQDPIYGCIAHIFALQQQVACLTEEIEVIANQMANFGEGFVNFDEIQDNVTSDHEYFVTQSDIIENCNYQPNVHSGNDQDEDFQPYVDSSILETLFEELSQDYYNPW